MKIWTHQQRRYTYGRQISTWKDAPHDCELRNAKYSMLLYHQQCFVSKVRNLGLFQNLDFADLLFVLSRAKNVLSRVQVFATPRTAAHQASLSFTISQSLLKPMSIEPVMPSNHLILCCPFSSCPQSLPASDWPRSTFSLCLRFVDHRAGLKQIWVERLCIFSGNMEHKFLHAWLHQLQRLHHQFITGQKKKTQETGDLMWIPFIFPFASVYTVFHVLFVFCF